MKVSVIICTHLVERFQNGLYNTLKSLEKQTYPDLDTIIIVDGNRKLYEIIMSQLSSFYKREIKVILNKKNMGLAHCRNLGVKNSKGDVVAFLDDDVIADSHWIENILDTYNSFPNCIGVGGRILPLWESKKPIFLPKELYWLIGCSYENSSGLQEVRNTFGSNLSFRKKTFDSVGLFNESLGKKSGEKGFAVQGEETEFCIRASQTLGNKIILNPKAIVYHRVNYNTKIWNYIIRRSFDEGYSKAIIRSFFPNNVLKTETSYLKNLIFQYFPNKIKTNQSDFNQLTRDFFTPAIVVLMTISGYYSFKLNQFLLPILRYFKRESK